MWCVEANRVFLGPRVAGSADSSSVLFQLRVYPFPLQNVEKPVQMMFKKSTFKITYIGEIFTQILVLPYVGGELNMIIMLPDGKTDLKTVTKR